MSAVCLSFKPCFSTMDLAITAFTAGKTVFTPTSHGSIKFAPNLVYFIGKTYLNMPHVIDYDACQDGEQYANSSTPYSHTPTPIQTHACKGE